MTEIPSFTDEDVLLRDGYECAYCVDDWADGVDLVVSGPRGGKRAWGNVVSACAGCRRAKGDSHPRELGWTLRYQPIAPRRRGLAALARAA